MKRIALMGHSGSGKSSCFPELGIDRKQAEMDSVLGVNASPPLEVALDWLANKTNPQIVVVSNHEAMLSAMAKAKSSGQFQLQFSRIKFMYFHKPKDLLKVHLALPNADGKMRSKDNQQQTLNSYDRFHKYFQSLADVTIDCSASVADVTAQINQLGEDYGQIHHQHP